MKSVLLLTAAAFLVLSAMAPSAAAPDPLGITNKALGGGQFNQYTPGVAGGVGLNNIGLLVKTWGTVTHVDADQQLFYIDDGSKLDDKSGFTGVRVSYKDLAPGNTFTPPNVNDRLAITGISSTTELTLPDLTKRIIPTLRPRRDADKTPL